MKYSITIPFCIMQFASAQSPAAQPLQLEEVVVTSSPLARTLLELAQPAAVLKEKELRDKKQATLGETLNGLLGVSSTNFGPGASRPIIRGLSDDRVRILQNGTSVLDVSNVSPDHAVAADPATLTSIEVVRGPATLLYGPNAVGGVVNAIDGRIPDQRFEGSRPSGSVEAQYGTADELFSQSASFDGGGGPFAFHLDVFRREGSDMRIPGFARSKRLRELDPQPDEAFGILPNSSVETEGASLGGSYIWDHGFIGASYSGMDSAYGTVAEEDVAIVMHQRRWDLRGAWYESNDWIKEINFKFSYTDYDHVEIEGGEVGTEFLIDGYNFRTEILHQKRGAWEGVFGFETLQNDFSALGAEAFLPAVENRTNSIFAFEEVDLHPFTLQFGVRYDRQSNETALLSLDYDAFSASTGIVYEPVENYAIAFTMAYSQRPPTYVELLADGLHVATGTFEVGDATLGKEDALSLDLSLRKTAGRVTGSVSAFYYRFNDFISLQPTGADFVDDGETFPIFAFQASGVDFYGAEFEAIWHLHDEMQTNGEKSSSIDQLDVVLRGDYVHAEDRDSGESMPRIAPFRTSIGVEYQKQQFSANISGQWVAKQDRVADYELPTDEYFMINAGLNYDIVMGQTTTTLSLKVLNLLDEEARQSTSFLKDVAPMAGRSVVVGLRTEF